MHCLIGIGHSTDVNARVVLLYFHEHYPKALVTRHCGPYHPVGILQGRERRGGGEGEGGGGEGEMTGGGGGGRDDEGEGRGERGRDGGGGGGGEGNRMCGITSGPQ